MGRRKGRKESGEGRKGCEGGREKCRGEMEEKEGMGIRKRREGKGSVLN